MIRFLLLPAVLASSLVFNSCGSKNSDERPRPSSRASALSVNGIVVKAKPLTNVVLSSGTILAAESVDLAPEASGRVDLIAFKEGGRVTKDALLVKINDDDLQAQLKKTELQIKLAADQEARQRQLLETNNTSKEQYDIALNQLTTLKADRDNLLSSIRKREIRAPFDGTIGLRYISEGSYVTPSTRIASVQKVDQLKIDFAIPEKYSGQVRVGHEVNISSEETGREFTGRIYAIEPRIDPQTRTLQLRAVCENRSGAMMPGAYVHIRLQLEETRNALVVPTQAVIPILKGQTVLIKRNGVVAAVNVKTGMRTSTDIQITDGLAEGDTVITTGILQLRPGMTVNVTIQ
ncbi:MAG TPA: efflux RND transporter periplasmic adaptor subunit [Bacteroidota bacterium]|nr:efflux RND transporter periplasmic adaptor subunit [Bacteroidota bacterium]